MAKTKATAPIDTSAGEKAYALAIQHNIEPRMPAGTLPALAADLTLLGAGPGPQPAPDAAQPSPSPSPPAPSLAEAMTDAVALITAIHGAIHGAKASGGVRRAYGALTKAESKEPKTVIAEGEKILARAQGNPTEALSLGILPEDTAALSQALADVHAAEAAVKGKDGKAGTTAKEKRAAEVRMHEVVARIAGIGALAFAKNPAVRAEFEALKQKKKA